MTIRLVCHGCQSKLKAPEAAIGRSLKCPQCGNRVPVIAPAPSAPPALAAPPAETAVQTTAPLPETPAPRQPVASANGTEVHQEKPAPAPNPFPNLEIPDDPPAPEEHQDFEILEDGSLTGGLKPLEEELEQAKANEILDVQAVEEDDEIVEDVAIVDDDAVMVGDNDLIEDEVVDVVAVESDEPRKQRSGFLDREKYIIKGLSGGGLEGMLKKKLEYDVLDAASKKRIGMALEAPEGGVEVLQHMVGKMQLPSKIEVWEGNRRDLVFIIKKPPRILGFSLKGDIYDGDNRMIGSITGKGLFNQYRNLDVTDRKGKPLGKVKVQWWPMQITFHDRDGARVGLVTPGAKLVESSNFRWFPRGSIWQVTVAKGAKTNPELKILLLAAPMILDLGYYDNMHTGALR